MSDPFDFSPLWDLHPASIVWDDGEHGFAGPPTISGDVDLVQAPIARWRCTLSAIPAFGGRIFRYRALMARLRGSMFTVKMPFWDEQRSPRQLAGLPTGIATATYSDGATHADGAPFEQDIVDAVVVDAAPAGASMIRIQLVNPIKLRAGHYFGFWRIFGHVIGEIREVWGKTDVYDIVFQPELRLPVAVGQALDTERPCVRMFMTSDSQARALDLVKGRRGQATLVFQERKIKGLTV